MDVIKRTYTDLDSPAGYSAPENLFQEARKLDPNVTRADVRKFLEGNTTYTLHRRRRLKFPRKRIVPAAFFSHMQVDLMDMSKLAAENEGYTFVLVAVEVLSRMVYTVPVRTKKAEHMIEAFKHLFSQTAAYPLYLYSDRGTEFGAAKVRKYLAEQDIQLHMAFVNTVKASLAERFIRSLKEKLYRYFSDKSTLRWLEALPRIAAAMNKSIAKSTGVRPCDVNFKNAPELWRRVYGADLKRTSSGRYPQIKKGDAVRLAREKFKFEKGYLPTFSDEILLVRRVVPGNPTTYELEDQQGEVFLGRFYRPELCKTRIDEETVYRIEKIIKTKKQKGRKQLLIKFRGVREPRWIDESDIV